MAEDKAEEEGKEGGSNKKMLIIIGVLVVMLIGGGIAGAMLFLGGDEEATAEGEAEVEEVERGPTIYQSLDPKFIVSFQDTKYARFMQFSVDVIMHKEEVKDQIVLHMPAIRSSLLMMFGDQKANEVGTKEGKEALLIAITKDVNATLEKMEGKNAIKDGVEQAYFNEFLIQ